MLTGASLTCLVGIAAAEQMCHGKQGSGHTAVGDNGDEGCWTDYYDRRDCVRYQQAAVIVGKGNDSTAKEIINALATSFCGPDRALPVESSGNDLSPGNYLAALVVSAVVGFFG